MDGVPPVEVVPEWKDVYGVRGVPYEGEVFKIILR